ncbi:MAG: HAD hydrolase-like protein [Phycisphaerales bacterium]|nr:HAD hydrolase-like protein [Phycisphaerales bacterium]
MVFDLDDTLYPERQFALGGFRAVAAAFTDVLGPVESAVRDMTRLFDSAHRRRVFDQLLLERGAPVDAALVQRMIACYRGHTPILSLHDDARRALARLRSVARLALISDGPSAVQWAKLDSLAIRPAFEHIILTDELGEGAGKPSPLAFERVMSLFAAKAAPCAYVADNPAKDFVAPNPLGWKSVRILRADGIYADAPPAPGGEPAVTIESLDELDAQLPTAL